MPKGNLLKQKRPIGEMKVVDNRDSLDSGICQKPLHASRHVKYLACGNFARFSSTAGRIWRSLQTLLFKCVKSTQIRTALFFLGTTTIGAHQSVSSVTGEIIPSFSIFFNSATTQPCSGLGLSWGTTNKRG